MVSIWRSGFEKFGSCFDPGIYCLALLGHHATLIVTLVVRFDHGE